MAPSDRTSMGGGNSSFPTTLWTEIARARTYDAAHRRQVIEGLMRKYWKPVYCYLRRKGYDNETSKDLTQGFFQKLVLGRELIQKAEEAKGRFRTFMLTALDYYTRSVHRAEARQKRSPRGEVVSLEAFEEISGRLASAEMEPDKAFTYMWASSLLDDVLKGVERGCFSDGKQTHWELFRARVVEPILHGVEPVPLRELCRRFTIEDEAKASNMIITVKRRFQTLIKSTVCQYVDSEQEVEWEIRDLMAILGGGISAKYVSTESCVSPSFNILRNKESLFDT